MLGGRHLSTPPTPGKNGEDRKIRVCIRGIGGLLGSRLASALKTQENIEVVSGIAKKDQTIERFKNRIAGSESILPAKKLYLCANPEVTTKVNRELGMEFIPCDLPRDMAKITEDCDVIVDATTNASAKWEGIDREIAKPVILQSGEYPRGRLLVPPIITNDEEQIFFRQGDCIQCALTPVLANLRSVLSKARIHILMQYTGAIEQTISQRVHAQYIREDERPMLQRNLDMLFPEKIEVESLVQIPGLEYYLANITIETNEPISPLEVRGLLENRPRIRLFSQIRSTYEIDHHIREPLRLSGLDIPPITIIASDLESSTRTNRIRLNVAVAYRYIAILPNIDSVRMLALGISGNEAMRLTDRGMGFVE